MAITSCMNLSVCAENLRENLLRAYIVIKKIWLMKKYLVDTCIWRDFYENRTNKFNRNLGKLASDFFLKAIKNKFTILFCESLIWELRKEYNLKEINELLGLLDVQGILKRLEIEKKEHEYALFLSKKRKLPYVDCLTALLAKKHNAEIITRDKHFLVNLKDIATALRPEDII